MSVAWQPLPSPLPTAAESRALQTEMRARFGFVAAESARWVQSVRTDGEALVMASVTTRVRFESATDSPATWGNRFGGPVLCLTDRRFLLLYGGRYATVDLSTVVSVTSAPLGRLVVTTASEENWRLYLRFWVTKPRRARDYRDALQRQVDLARPASC